MLLVYGSPWARVSKCYFPINGSIPRGKIPFICVRATYKKRPRVSDALANLGAYRSLADNGKLEISHT